MTSHYGRTVVKSVTETSIHFSFDSALCNLGGGEIFHRELNFVAAFVPQI